MVPSFEVLRVGQPSSDTLTLTEQDFTFPVGTENVTGIDNWLLPLKEYLEPFTSTTADSEGKPSVDEITTFTFAFPLEFEYSGISPIEIVKPFL